jgi:ferritin-like metal-binding protein YciE
MAKEKFNDFKELFIHELKDIYSAENMLLEGLEKNARAASNSKLRHAFEEHKKETMEQKKRLDEIANMLNVKLEGATCEAMKGLIKEGEEMIEAQTDGNIKDAGLIGGAQRIEHYEIAAYGTAVTYANQLGYDDVARILKQTLEEEKKTDMLLNDIAVNDINKRAMA